MKDGVYLGLPHPEYLSERGVLGSTDFTSLFARREGWWWGSEHNPHAKRQESEAMTFGSAAHCLFLEGRDAYTASFAVMPNPNDFPDLLVDMDDLRSALTAAQQEVKKSMKKNDLVQMAKAFLPDRHVWDDIVERWSRTAKDKAHIGSADAFALEAMYASAMADKETRTICSADGGVRLTEVSVFWTGADGIRRRYRFDALLPRINVDMKTVGSYRKDPLLQICEKRVSEDHLEVQLAMSFEARRALYQAVAEKRVYGGSREERAWLAKFPEGAPLNFQGQPGWFWVWLFFQKPDAGAAPGLLPVRAGFGSREHLEGARKYLIAEAFYRDRVTRWGLAKPWTNVAPAATSDERQAAATGAEVFRVPPWNNAPDQPVAGERELLKWQ